jgi:ABC-type sugar transport system ATPase subunit
MPPILEVRDVVKRFGGIVALDGVTFSLARGEVRAIAGENGAGKSTLIKVMSGVHAPDGGEIVVDGTVYAGLTPRLAQRLGISVIHQEFNLFPALSVAENVSFGREPKTRIGTLDRRRMRREALALLGRLGADIDPTRLVADLSVAERQLVEIAKALGAQARIVIMDEPSAVLAGHELENLFGVVRALRREGTSVIYISHRLEEVFAIADRVTVLRDGRTVLTRATGELSQAELVRLMVGRDVSTAYPHRSTAAGEPRLRVRDLNVGAYVRGISLDVRAGEIVGIAGLVGSGRTTLARALAGLERPTSGSIDIDGRGGPRSPADAMAKGLVMVPEDRMRDGLLLDRSVAFNLSLPLLRRLSRRGLVDHPSEASQVIETIRSVDLRPPDPGREAGRLSGGNQQKVVIGKCLASSPRVLVIDEPTRGIDVAAKAEIHARLRAMADDGVAILMISSELPEVLGMSDRVLVMREARIIGERDGRRADAIWAMSLATGEGAG